jgi:hypothetical protein
MAFPHILLIFLLLLSTCCSYVQVLAANHSRHSDQLNRRAGLRSLYASAFVQSAKVDASTSSSIEFFASSRTATATTTNTPISKPHTKTNFNTSNSVKSFDGIQGSPHSAAIVDEFHIIAQRRIVNIINKQNPASNISAW